VSEIGGCVNRLVTTVKVRTYNDGTTPGKRDIPEIIVKSHWNHGDRVHICIGSKDVVVIGRDLILAIEKAVES
jgi:hypothetical protein